MVRRNSPDQTKQIEISRLLGDRPAHYDKELGWVTPSLKPDQLRQVLYDHLLMLLDSYESYEIVSVPLDVIKQITPGQPYGDKYVISAWISSWYDADLHSMSSPRNRPPDDMIISVSTEQYYCCVEDDVRTSSLTPLPGYQPCTHYEYRYYVQDRSGQPMIDVKKPHGFNGCQGYGIYAGPYHIKCTGCKSELRMWEWGVDYDVG